MHKPKKLGRPSVLEDREKLVTISFKADKETLVALEKLENQHKATWGSVAGSRSAVIRQALRILAQQFK